MLKDYEVTVREMVLMKDRTIPLKATSVQHAHEVVRGHVNIMSHSIVKVVEVQHTVGNGKAAQAE